MSFMTSQEKLHKRQTASVMVTAKQKELALQGDQEELHKRQIASVMVTTKQKKLGVQRVTGEST